MLINKKFLYLNIFLFFLLITCCSSLNSNRVEWEKLKDRKFHFLEFKYIHVDSDKKKAFSEMKNFPVKKIMYILAHEYNVEIDLTDFVDFIKQNDESKIKTDGYVRKESFTWLSSEQNINNRVTVTFEKDYFDESKMKMILTAYSNDKKLRSINISFSKQDHIFTQMKFILEHSEQNLVEYYANDYENKLNVPGLIINTKNIIRTSDKSVEDEIKLKVQEYVKKLDSTQKETFKHEMIDYIYKICE